MMQLIFSAEIYPYENLEQILTIIDAVCRSYSLDASGRISRPDGREAAKLYTGKKSNLAALMAETPLKNFVLINVKSSEDLGVEIVNSIIKAIQDSSELTMKIISSFPKGSML